MPYNRELFRSIMNELIDGSTQIEFANTHGISPEHLSRMMRSDTAGRPSKSTLKKIAGGSETVYDALLRACGHIKEKADAGKIFSLQEKIDIRIEEIKNGFSDMTKNVHVYDSIDEFLDEYGMLYDSCHVSFTKGEKREYDSGGRYKAEYSMPVMAKYEFTGRECRIWAVLYFSETKGGRVVVLDFAMDGKAIVEAETPADEERAKAYSERPYLYSVKTYKSAEEVLLTAIFGESGGNEKKVPSSVIGFGFNFADTAVTAGSLKRFLEVHGHGCPANMTDAAEKVLNSLSASEDDCSVNIDDETGDLIAEIIKEETGIGFCYFESSEGGPGAVIVERERYGDYDIDDMKEAAGRYAKELGIDHYGECVVYTYDYLDSNMRFSTKEEK